MKNRRLIPPVAPHHIPLIVVALAAVVLSVGLVLTLMQQKAPASSGNIYLAQASVAAEKDAEVRFDVRITPGAHIDTVTATAKYDPSKLTFTSASYTDSPFGSQIPAVNQDGRVTVQAAKLGGQTVESDAFVATLVFTALTAGTQTVELTDGNAARAGTATNPTVSGKTVTRPASQSTGSASGQSGTDGQEAADDTQDDSIIGAASQPVAALLSAVGVSPQTAQRAAPWVGGLLLCIIVVAVVVTMRTVRRKKGNKQKETPHGQAPIS